MGGRRFIVGSVVFGVSFEVEAKGFFIMIEWLEIRNLALVERAELEFSSGFNVITGETGAGKSVVMGAVSLLLGERADKGMIGRFGERCEIRAGLSLSASAAADRISSILDDVGVEFDSGEALIIRRVVSASSSRNHVNDTPVTLSTLRRLGDVLIDVHGAHEHQSLLDTGTQLEILDRYGGHSRERVAVSDAFDALSAARSELDSLEAELPSGEEAERLRFMVSEIEKAAPEVGEDAALSERHKLAANSRMVVETAADIASELEPDEGGGAFDALSAVRRGLASLEKLGIDSARSLVERCDALAESVRELSLDVERLATSVEMDDAEFAEMEGRLGVLERLKRKYGPTLEDVLSALDAASARLDALENFEERRAKLAEKVEKASGKLEKVCAGLSRKRAKAAEKLSTEAVAELAELGLEGADFAVGFSDVSPGRRGSDKVEFLFSANPGVEKATLRKVASSGEMSRVMLALKRILAEADDVPILIFDEIDVNIGGETAAVVGAELAELAKSRQLVCISHLPAVAAAAEKHFKIEKNVSQGKTTTAVEPLDAAGRKTEVARMLGGGKAADNHAKELLRRKA